MIWYDVKRDMIYYDMICQIRSIPIRCDRIWFHMRYMGYDFIRYDRSCYNVVWYSLGWAVCHGILSFGPLWCKWYKLFCVKYVVRYNKKQYGMLWYIDVYWCDVIQLLKTVKPYLCCHTSLLAVIMHKHL